MAYGEGVVKVKLTKHFQDMVQYRGIDMYHVKSAIEKPDETEEVYGGKIMVRKAIGSRTIEVIYSKNSLRYKSSEYVVITAYYL